MNSTPSSSIHLFFSFILIVLYFLIVTKGEFTIQPGNATQDEFQSDFQFDSRGRFKRSLFERMPPILTIQIPTVTGTVMIITWMKIKTHLANKYLPVFLSSQSLSLNVMEDVGEFIIYRDLEMCSAVVYFQKSHSLSGFIGLNYNLMDLPYGFDDAGRYLGVVDESYIRFEGNGPGHGNPILSNVPQMLQYPLDDVAGPSNKRQRIERNLVSTSYEHERNTSGSIIRTIRKRRRAHLFRLYYLEILIFITQDVAQLYQTTYGENEIYIQMLVKDYIIYFNGVDMMFQKLKMTIQPHINIAKIVIEDVLKPFDFTSDYEIEFPVTVAELRQHLHHNRHIHTRDSYDHVFISTNHPIKTGGIHVPGKTTPSSNIYEARKRDEPHHAVSITILGYHQPYVLAVHEISKIFNVETDSWLDGLEQTGQCNSIMQEGSSRCGKCLKWSLQSKTQFSDFLRNNRNRCFLLNPPRSLHPPLRPSYSLAPNSLCRCFGYESNRLDSNGIAKREIGARECSGLLKCRNSNGGEVTEEETIHTLDGTRCHSSKVCWGQVCTYYQATDNQI